MRDASFLRPGFFLRFVSTKLHFLKFQHHIFSKTCISPQQKLVPAGGVFCTGAFCFNRMITFASFITSIVAYKSLLLVLPQQNDQF